MPKPTQQVAHRRIAADRLQAYEGREHRCLRDVLFWLIAGPDATRTGLRYCRPTNIAHELGWSVGNVEAALDRLQADGVIVRSPEQRSVLCLDALACGVPTNDDHRVSLRRDIERHAPCVCATKALEMIGANPDTKGHTKSDRVSDISVQRTVISDQTVAAAPPVVEPTATASEQLTLTLKTPKPKREPDPKWAQAEIVRGVWNEFAALNPNWAHSSKLTIATVNVLAAALRRLTDYDGVFALFKAIADDPWFGGDRRSTPWDVAQFCATANLDKAIAQSRRTTFGGTHAA